ncbi:hypothetical protein PHMEG_00036885, partial [Phytophthora megakarya]
MNPANIPLPRTPKKTTRAVFGSAEQSPYFHDSHMVTPRSESRKARVAREAEQAESTANTRPGTGRSSSRRQTADDDSSSDEDNLFYQDNDENDATTELALLSDKFISYYCSQFSQSASTRYYRAKRSQKEHIRDYPNRLNGYERSANIKFERSGHEAKEHVKHFLETCGDRDLVRQLTPMLFRDIHTLEDIVSDIQKVEKRVSSRLSSQSSSRRDDKRHTSSSGSYGRHDSRSQERSRSEPRHTSRVALVDASVTDLITELQTRASSERPDEYLNDYSNDNPIDFYEEDEADQDECDSDCGSRDEMQGEDTYSDQDERLVAAANDNERRNAANGTFARTCGGQNHSTHYCFRRCRLCQQVHDFGKCEAFDETAKILRTSVDKKNISPELQKL